MSYEITDFQKDIIERSRTIPVVVDFWAEWCGPCRVLGPILERLAAKSENRWALAKVNTDIHQEEAARYGIRSIPNVKLFIDGEVRDEFVGAIPEPSVVRWLEKVMPSPLRNDIAKAEELLKNGSMDEAVRLLSTVVAADPANHRARTMLARTILFTDPFRALELVEGIEPDSEFFDEAEAVRTLGAMLQRDGKPEVFPEGPMREIYRQATEAMKERRFDDALGKYIDVIRNDRFYDNDGARKTCIALFRVLGEEDPVTQRHRREFGSALYV